MAQDQSACILCSRNCGIVVEHDRQRIQGVKGDEHHPISKGYICQKPARLTHYQDNADRLEHPLKRQPDGSFVRVSWDEAIADIAARLVAIRDGHGGKAYAFYGGGGQGNHLGGAYSRQIGKAMKSRYSYNALGQEKTGDFWVNGRLFGDQRCHITEDVEHADCILFIGCNPYHAHGIPNARDLLRDIKKDSSRTMVVIDPRRTETAKHADVHLQVRPGMDAFLIAAMLAIIVRDGLHDREFLAQRCTGFAALEAELHAIPIDDFVRRADVPLADVERVARTFARAKSACVRVDLGIQQSLHSTLNSYLEKLLFLVTGNLGKRGSNNFHSWLIPILGNTDERNPKLVRSVHHQMHPIAGILPPNILPAEIERAGEDRIRAVIVDSANPALTGADTQAYERAFSKLELLVVVDVAMTETARLAHYVLPAASQFEKWEFTGFNLEFPANAFHLRHPLFPPRGESLPEPEIYTRILEAMGAIPKQFRMLSQIARREPATTKHAGFLAAFGATLAANRRWMPYAASIIYRTLGPALETSRSSSAPAAAAPLLALALDLANREPDAVRRAGHRGNRFTLGINLFHAILERPEGTMMTVHEYRDAFGWLKHDDHKVHLEIPEMLSALRALREEPTTTTEFPLVLIAGERRMYNANQIYRNPEWRKVDPHGAMRMHPDDARTLGLEDGARAVCTSQRGELEVTIDIDDSVRTGMVMLPHGYGMRYQGGEPNGPQLNRLTAAEHCDPIAKTPYHKHVPVRVRAVSSGTPARP